MKNILHITTNNIFISAALATFENVYPKQNTVWVFDKSGEGSSQFNTYFSETISFWRLISPSVPAKLQKFDLVVLHSLSTYWLVLMLFAPRGTRFAWLGWGHDYYSYICDDASTLLLEETSKLEARCREQRQSRLNFSARFKELLKFLVDGVIQPYALRRVGTFSPVLKEDYDLVCAANIIPVLPRFMPWNYGSLEGHFIKNFLGQRTNGNSILIGNSASSTNNHVEAFRLISDSAKGNNTEVIVPLSYGDQCYKNEIVDLGQQILGDCFHPITDFLSLNDYVELIKHCGSAIMNHKRQQGVGNVVIMLYLGARVFLREDNPTYLMLKREGAVLNTVQELQDEPSLLFRRLKEYEVQKNIDILYQHWSEDAIDSKTKALVEFHMGAAPSGR